MVNCSVQARASARQGCLFYSTIWTGTISTANFVDAHTELPRQNAAPSINTYLVRLVHPFICESSNLLDYGTDPCVLRRVQNPKRKITKH